MNFYKVPGRMGMIVTLYLISTNVYNSVDAPRNRGFSYIEVWILGTQFPILLALFEYGYVLYLKKIVKESEDRSQILNLDEKILDLDERIKQLDFATMILSFFSFTAFASFYWIILLM